MKPIKIDHAVLDQAHSDMRHIARQLDEELDALRSRLTRIDWQGRDNVAYWEHQREWDAAVQDLNRLLNEIGAKVGFAREEYVTTEAEVRHLWG